jgi:transposase InsO family protein/DNA-binding XRE family transcriptional regulator
MPGKKISKNQVRDYMTYRKSGNSQKKAASKVDISEKSGRNIESGSKEKVQKTREWRTRANPFETVWDDFVVPMLKGHPTLDASFIMEKLQEKYEGQFPDNKLRTFQRHVREWKALYGKDKAIIFRQEHYPGIRGISDFTELKNIDISINGVPFKHLLYHFRLAYSGWSYMKVIQGGESFSALSEGLQEALWRLGGSPKEHRTDSLSAAFKNLSKSDQEDLTKRYKEFCKHYNMIPTRNNKGVSHENGSVESPHGHVKHRIKQSLDLRGSSDFTSIDDFEKWLGEAVRAHNRRNAKEVDFEREHLQNLPPYKTTDFEELVVGVTSSCTVEIRRVTYSVPARLIGQKLRALIYQRRIECYLGSTKVFESARGQPKSSCRSRIIDYKHLIGGLVKKPQAFRYSQIREDILPTDIYKRIWNHVDEIMDARTACKFIVGILYLASKHDCERAIGDHVIHLIETSKTITLAKIEEIYRPLENEKVPDIEVKQHSLSSYDSLIDGGSNNG